MVYLKRELLLGRSMAFHGDEGIKAIHQGTDLGSPSLTLVAEYVRLSTNLLLCFHVQPSSRVQT